MIMYCLYYFNAAIRKTSILQAVANCLWTKFGLWTASNHIIYSIFLLWDLRRRTQERDFEMLLEGPCVFVKESEDVYILIYVDDAVIAQTDE